MICNRYSAVLYNYLEYSLDENQFQFSPFFESYGLKPRRNVFLYFHFIFVKQESIDNFKQNRFF